MLYHLLDYLQKHFDIPGAGLFQYLSFRSVAAIVIALVIGAIFGKKIIAVLRRRQIGEDIRNLGLAGQMEKKGTPTMGGLIIIGALLVPVLLVCNLSNVYVWLMIATTVCLGALGFTDDYIKVFKKRKDGLKGKIKIVGQVGLGIVVGTVMCFNQEIVVEKVQRTGQATVITVSDTGSTNTESVSADGRYILNREKGTTTTIPFFKNNEFDYHWLVPGDTPWGNVATWLIYILVAIFIITWLSNAANLTDGLDGLSAGVAAIVVVVLGAFAYLSGNVIYSEYLGIMYIPGSGELTVFAAAMVGALIGFLWYNCFPAQVFMGDTGSLTIGGIIAVFSLLVRKELLLPLLCGVYLAESFSVVIQVMYFKYMRRRYGEGKRYFLMAPLHHHYQKKGIAENKIVVRFWILQILLAAITLITLKIR
jgi:phospho-N-acetylmuramoyl-pentapeptide-transferase